MDFLVEKTQNYQILKKKVKFMKTVLKLSLVIMCFLFITNCSQKITGNLDNEIQVTLKNTDAYELDLLISGDEEGASIKTQAINMKRSELDRNATTNWSVVYYYQPKVNFVGSEYVEILTCTRGASKGCSDIKIVKINFTIIN